MSSLDINALMNRELNNVSSIKKVERSGEANPNSEIKLRYPELKEGESYLLVGEDDENTGNTFYVLVNNKKLKLVDCEKDGEPKDTHEFVFDEHKLYKNNQAVLNSPLARINSLLNDFEERNKNIKMYLGKKQGGL